jgi:hypothetical protein
MPTNWNASSRGLQLCFNHFFPKVHYSYSLASEELKLHTLRVRWHHLVALFLIQVYLGSKFCPSVLEIAVFEFLLGTLETLLCSMSAPQAKMSLS